MPKCRRVAWQTVPNLSLGCDGGMRVEQADEWETQGDSRGKQAGGNHNRHEMDTSAPWSERKRWLRGPGSSSDLAFVTLSCFSCVSVVFLLRILLEFCMCFWCSSRVPLLTLSCPSCVSVVVSLVPAFCAALVRAGRRAARGGRRVGLGCAGRG